MFILERSTLTGDPRRTLRRLELTVMWLWSGEPDCDPGTRQDLLARLGLVSLSIEQLVLRHELSPDIPVDLEMLAIGDLELDDLSSWWPDPVSSEPR
jgi:hypothetical protein